ncbi:MAG: UxaA family hydrolase, partial [Bacteroidota bacterium]
GQVGVANYWLVIPLVFCENRNVDMLRKALETQLGYARPDSYQRAVSQLSQAYVAGKKPDELATLTLDFAERNQPADRLFANVDGIKFLKHQAGCGGTRDDAQALVRLLAGYITHPNVAGATVLSLGCQNAQVSMLEDAIKQIDGAFAKPLYILEQQGNRTEPQFMADAIRQTFAGLAQANTCERKPAPVSALRIGLECGGSDGFSGISANPTLGQVSDLLVGLGGSAMLAEFPELSGVEQEMVNRSVDDETATKFVELMRRYEAAAISVGSGFDANPSPGNIKDGLITDGIKSAGAARKGGTSPVVEVLDYTEQPSRPGLALLCTPGNDVESTTALAASGAQIILFTTGLGTPTGNPIAPTLKVASNTDLATRMADIIDYDAGKVITGEKTLTEAGEELLERVLEVANGTYTPHAVRLQQDDFIPWKRGVSL